MHLFYFILFKFHSSHSPMALKNKKTRKENATLENKKSKAKFRKNHWSSVL